MHSNVLNRYPARTDENSSSILRNTLANDVDLDKIAEITHGYVGADLAAVAMKAATSCIRRSAVGLVDMKEEDIPAEFLESLAVRMSDFMQAVKETGSSTIRDVTVQKPNVSFKDIGGLENVKKELKEMINFPSKYEELFRDIGVRPPTRFTTLRTSRLGKDTSCQQWRQSVTRLSRLRTSTLTKWFGESRERSGYFRKPDSPHRVYCSLMSSIRLPRNVVVSLVITVSPIVS